MAKTNGHKACLDPETERRMRAIFYCLIHDILDAIEEFGYEAVYFGVGCEVFPDAVDPWDGNDN